MPIDGSSAALAAITLARCLAEIWLAKRRSDELQRIASLARK